MKASNYCELTGLVKAVKVLPGLESTIEGAFNEAGKWLLDCGDARMTFKEGDWILYFADGTARRFGHGDLVGRFDEEKMNDYMRRVLLKASHG